MIEFPISITHLDRIAVALEKLVQIQSAARFTFTLHLGELNTMPIYVADKADFDVLMTISGKDSEGNVLPDIDIPEGFTLIVTSDNSAAFAVAQDTAQPKLLHCHVGGPNADTTPSQSNVLAVLNDAAGNMVATGGALVTVTAGKVATVTGITLNLPEA